MTEEKKDKKNPETEIVKDEKNNSLLEDKKIEATLTDEADEFDSADDDLFSDDDLKNENKNEIEDLPEEIKQKLEKNKQARSKKKLIKKKKKKENIKIKSGHAYINATYNNTIISLADKSGNIISWASAGMAGFKGAKKATPYAAQIITKIAVLKAREEYGLEEVKVFVAGVGTGREAAIRALNANGLEIASIKDVTGVPHNGCRPKKPRRV
jgi:small subunit ribosomal protein S11